MHPKTSVAADDSVPGVNVLLVLGELTQDVCHVPWHDIQVFANGLMSTDLAWRYCGGQQENVLPDTREEWRGAHAVQRGAECPSAATRAFCDAQQKHLISTGCSTLVIQSYLAPARWSMMLAGSLFERSQHRVDLRLVAGTTGPEPVENVGINA